MLVGENPASQMYVGMKNKAATAAGLHSRQITLAAATSRRTSSWAWSQGLNADPAIHGILVQLPLPDHMDEATVIEAISPRRTWTACTP